MENQLSLFGFDSEPTPEKEDNGKIKANKKNTDLAESETVPDLWGNMDESVKSETESEATEENDFIQLSTTEKEAILEEMTDFSELSEQELDTLEKIETPIEAEEDPYQIEMETFSDMELDDPFEGENTDIAIEETTIEEEEPIEIDSKENTISDTEDFSSNIEEAIVPNTDITEITKEKIPDISASEIENMEALSNVSDIDNNANTLDLTVQDEGIKLENEQAYISQENEAFVELSNDEINTSKPAKEPASIEEEEQNLIDTTSNSIADTQEIVTDTLPTKFSLVSKKGRKSFKEIDAEVDLIQVPSDEVLFTKQYYPISQVAKWFRVNNSLLRFWENEFEILKPRKNRKGDRLFRPEDIKNLQIIYYLLRQKKYTIAGAKKYIKNNKKTVDVNMKIIQTLNDFKGFLLELKANAERQ